MLKLNYTILLLSLKIIAISTDRSFTVVLDTTKSMSEEINIIKANIAQLVNSFNRTDIQNYILVTFKDILVESPFITDSPRYFISHLSTVTPSGGSDCPENSLAGIEAALRASKQESYIFVFTDAYAKDYDKFQSIERLCRESHSQVIIFLSGFCLPSRTTAEANVDVYYDVAKACAGAFFRFDSYELRQAFSFMKEVLNTDWTDIMPQEKFTNHKQLSFSVDSFTTDFLIGVSASNPIISILDSNSKHLRSADRVLFTRHALVVHLNRPDPGQYSVDIRGQGNIVVTFFEKNYIPFQYGFSTKAPRSLMETSLRPLPGWSNYVLISIDASIKLNSIEWLNAGEDAKKIIYLEEKRPGLYITDQHFVEPGKNFRIWIIGQDTVTQQNIKGSTKYIFPQVTVANLSWTRPEVEILDKELNLVDYATELTLACKVTGFPKPNIRWEDGKANIFPSEDIMLEIPSVYISYVTIANVTENSTIYCKSENSNGDVSQTIDIFVNRTYSFDVNETPEDTTVEYGQDLKLSCQVTAYPEAKVEWYFNSTKIDSFSKMKIEENSLTVRNVSIDDGGIYDCVASNEVETNTFSAIVSISGLEPPAVEIEDTEILVKLGDWTNVTCSVTSGKPMPDVTWQYKSFDSYEYDELPTGATVEDGEVKISTVDKQHGGIYRCTASNILGKDFKDVTIRIQYPPVIKKNEIETLTVIEGDLVQLICEVEATPEATVRWEMSQDDTIITLGERHTIDDQHTLRFTALWNDPGNYHCIGENELGRAERTVTVNVLVSPYIEPPKLKTVNLKLGGKVDLACNVLYGNPAPSTKWEFTAVDSTSKVLTRGNSTLHLENVSQSDEGLYMCIAENQIGTDRIKYSLKVN